MDTIPGFILKNKRLIQILIGIIIILLIFTKIDFFQTIKIMFSVNPIYLFISILLYVILNLSHAIRLKISLKSLNHDISLKDAFRAQICGMLIGDITPGRIGYFSCAYPLKKRNKIPISDTMSAVTIYQSIEFILKAIQGGIGVIFLIYLIGLSQKIVYLSIIALGFASFCGIVLLIISTNRKFMKALNVIKRFKIGEQILNFFYRFQDGSRGVKKGSFIPIFFLTFIGWFFRATEWFFLAKAIGINLPWLICLFLHPVLSAVEFVPFSPAGFGFYEGSIVIVFSSLLSISPASALAFTLLDRINNMFINLFAIKEVFE